MPVESERAEHPWYLSATPLATLPWLVRLRWTSAAVMTALIAFAAALPHLDFPLRRVTAFVALSALLHGARAASLQRRGVTGAGLDTGGLIADVALLTVLLEMTGGPFNPFGLVFAVQIAVAVLTLRRLEATAVVAAAIAGYALVVYWHAQEADPIHHRLNDFPTHLLTMWIAVAVTLELVAHFVLQASNALARREQELEAMRQQAARTERLMSMTTLAAGAAHELSTPLATIALASRELEHSAVRAGAPPALVDDARLIRAEVDRCRAILDQMSGRAGGVAADSPEAVDLAEVLDEVQTRLGEGQAKRVDVHPISPALVVYLPRAGLAQAVLSLVKNALDATADRPDLPVEVDVRHANGRVQVRVRDNGPGMAPHVLERAGEPFFTTKAAGRGLGLGLFLARIFAERVGGSLALDSSAGTTAVLDLPLRAESTGGGVCA